MALINCPECDNRISDKAISCPQCGYPISTNRNNSPSELTSNQNSNQTNKELLMVMTSKKSEGIAFILTFFFGPLGLFYVDSEKAVKLILFSILICFLLLFIDNSAFLTILFCVIIYIISIIMSINAVSEYNNEIILSLAENSTNPINYNYSINSNDLIKDLRNLIRAEKVKSFYNDSQKAFIIDVLEKICIDNTQCIILINEYRHRYKSDLIEDLKNLSKSYDIIKSLLRVFINLEVVKKDYPHEMINTSVM